MGIGRPNPGRALFAISVLILPFSTAGAQTLKTGVYNSPGQASAYGDPTTPDSLFVADGGSDKESFGVEGNVNLSNPSQELRINSLTGSAPGTFTFGTASNSGFQWVSGRTYGFTQSYSGDDTKQLVFTLNDAFTGTSHSVSQTVQYGNVGLLMIRERTPISTATQSSSILFSGLAVNGGSLGGDIALNSGTDFARAHYATISGVDFTKAWDFTGNITMSWTGTKPKKNQLSFQIKAMQGDFAVTPVPEPASSMLAALGLSLAILRRKR